MVESKKIMGFIRNTYRSFKKKWKFFWSVNWIKTYYFNYKMFPWSVAKKLPVFFYGSVKFSCLQGSITIDGPVKKAMIGFGQRFEKMSRHKGIAEFNLQGTLVFKGYTHIAKDCIFYVGKDAYCEFGDMSAFGSDVKLVCTHKVIIGNWTGIGYESQVIDTNSHPMIDTRTGERFDTASAIVLGDYNAISNRVSIMPGTKTPDNCVIASNSLCSKDYTSLGSEVLIGGIPAKLIRENFARDWEGEREQLIKSKVVRF